jgi:hypothetical protein
VHADQVTDPSLLQVLAWVPLLQVPHDREAVAAQGQTPALQVTPAAQACPQDPQLLASLVKSTHAPPHTE